MARIGKKLRSIEGGYVVFMCPGCGCGHRVGIEPPATPIWQWNGSGDVPTFSPSVLVRGTQFTELGQRQLEEWQASGGAKRTEKFDTQPTVCHSFVRDGKIQFLADCTHVLAGQTVDLPDFED